MPNIFGSCAVTSQLVYCVFTHGASYEEAFTVIMGKDRKIKDSLTSSPRLMTKMKTP